MFDLKAQLHERGSLPTEVDAKLLTEAAGKALHSYTQATIEQSIDPYTGGPKPALGQKAAKVKGRLGGRGYQSGEMARRLAIRVSGSSRVSSAKIQLPKERLIFLRSEAKRGITYLTVDGKAATIIDEAVDAALEEAIK